MNVYNIIILLLCFIWVDCRPRSKLDLEGLEGTIEEVFIMNNSQLKRGWCKTKPFRQVIKIDGCLPAEIQNNFCYGQCNSMFIPHHSLKEPAFESCASCIPVRKHRRSVILMCPNSDRKIRKYRYTYVKRCRCVNFKLRSTSIKNNSEKN